MHVVPRFETVKVAVDLYERHLINKFSLPFSGDHEANLFYEVSKNISSSVSKCSRGVGHDVMHCHFVRRNAKSFCCFSPCEKAVLHFLMHPKEYPPCKECE